MPDDYTQNSRRAMPVPRDELHLDHPPRGIKMERTLDGIIVITSRTFTQAGYFIILFALLWNGITSMAVCSGIAHAARKFGWNLPALAFMESEKPSTSQWPFWFFWIFITPFIAVGIHMMFLALFNLFGKCVIRLNTAEGSVFSGIGPLGRTQRFSPQSIKTFRKHLADSMNDSPIHRIVIEMNNGREIKLPSLGKMRETWLAFALEKILKLDK